MRKLSFNLRTILWLIFWITLVLGVITLSIVGLGFYKFNSVIEQDRLTRELVIKVDNSIAGLRKSRLIFNKFFIDSNDIASFGNSTVDYLPEFNKVISELKENINAAKSISVKINQDKFNYKYIDTEIDQIKKYFSNIVDYDYQASVHRKLAQQAYQQLTAEISNIKSGSDKIKLQLLVKNSQDFEPVSIASTDSSADRKVQFEKAINTIYKNIKNDMDGLAAKKAEMISATLKNYKNLVEEWYKSTELQKSNIVDFIKKSDQVDMAMGDLQKKVLFLSEESSKRLPDSIGWIPMAVLLTLLIMILIVSGLLWIASIRFGAGVDLLLNAVSEISQGNLSVTVPAKRDDELGKLGKMFNAMTGDLQKSLNNEKKLAASAAEATVDKRRAKELELAYKKLKDAQDQLVQSQKLESIGKLAGGIAHDFNNLMGGVLGNVDLLKSTVQHNAKAMSYLENIEKTSFRAAQLVQKLLGFARKGQYKEEVVDVNEIILEARNILYRTIDKTITIKSDPAPATWKVLGDPTQLLQVLVNLGVNARDAMPKGGELLFEVQNLSPDEMYCRHHSELEPGNEYVRITVSDTGMGMDKEHVKKIFEPFFSTKEVGKGTGLGLSMVYGIVKNHKGSVTVYSEVDKGTVFHIYLPHYKAEHKDDNKKKLAPKEDIGDIQNLLADKLILVVDDEEIIRDIAKDILEQQGAKVILASQGEEAIDLYKKHKNDIDLVVLDMVMPIMDGARVYHQLKNMNDDIKVVFSSGYTENAEIKDLQKSDGVSFIQKPFGMVRFVKLIKSIINQ